MFTELMPLLRQRAVMITISDVGQGLLRVNIIPYDSSSSSMAVQMRIRRSPRRSRSEQDRGTGSGNCPASRRPLQNRSSRTRSNLDEN